MSRYRFIAAERGHHPVRQLCQVLSVPASGFYAWQQGQQRAVGSEAPAWETALAKVFGLHKRRYGTRRLQVALRQKGHGVGRQRLRAAMRRRGRSALQPKAYPRARPTRATARAALPTGCSTSRCPPKLTGSGYRTSRTWPSGFNKRFQCRQSRLMEYKAECRLF